MITKVYVFTAYNGVEIVDTRLQAEDLQNNMDYLERRYQREQNRNRHTLLQILCRITGCKTY